MNAIPVPKERIEAEWGAIIEALWPAIRHDPVNVQGLYNRLMDGSAWLCEVGDGASGYWVVMLDMDGDKVVAWTAAVSGKIDGGPKQRVKYIRDAVVFIERILVNAGVTAHRICGRNWSTVLPEYLPYEGARNGLEKRLI